MKPEEVVEKMVIWDRLCKEAGDYDHLCAFKDGFCARGTPNCCVVQPGSRRENCDQLDPVHGCRIDTVMCKVWFCGFLKNLHPELAPMIARWAEETKKLPGIIYFQSRNDYQRMLENKF